MGQVTQTTAWMLILLLEISCFSHSSVVHVRQSLKVKRGQSAYLQQDHLHFLIPHANNVCKLEVVLNEPVTQRVGKLFPQVFDCSFLPEEVKYVHNGCPLLKEDVVKLRLYRFTDRETYTEEFSIHVDIVEEDCSIIRMGPKPLSVPEFYGISNVIDGNVVSFHYERKSSLECSLHLINHDTHLPAHGQLVTGEPEQATKRGDEPESFIHLRQQMENRDRAKCSSDNCLKGLKMVRLTKTSCDDFIVMGLRYQHTDPPSADIDYIHIRLLLKDTKSGSVYQAEEAWIPVQIIRAIPNQPPRPSFSSMFILEVDQFILTPISTATLDAEDEENPKELLIFNITKPPADGFITHLSDHTHPITSFTWTDLNDMLIGYQPPNSSHVQRQNYEAELEVHDLFFEKSATITIHISVRHSDTNAPRVSWNTGLSLLEGQSRPITWEQLQIVDNDNLNAVRLIVIDGLQHGRLTVKEEKSFVFTVSDIRAGIVCYHHDDSDSTKDFIIFRITDNRHQTRHNFPIKILPKDDSPPFLITNMLLEVSEGQRTLLRGSTLHASDMDSSDDYIVFNITCPPKAGEVMKIPGPALMGYPVAHFLQRDLSQSMIYYQHHMNQAFDDSFEVVLSDSHDPPNLSHPQVVMVHIEPAPDQPPQEVSGSSHCFTVRETDVVHITRKHLHFMDKHSLDSELIYTVTRSPFFSNHNSTGDAGRLFLVDSIPMFTKDPNTPVLMLFTQHAVNFMKVAYMPPLMDIGPYPKEIQFVLSVTNSLGKSVTGICFNITILPVDNQPPQVVIKPLNVDEGGESWIDSNNLILSDVDSVEEILRVDLRREPEHGALWLGGLSLKVGQTFTVQDLRGPRVRYIHDSSETTTDSIELSATDRSNSINFTLPVKVFPVNDEVPVLVAGLKPYLPCTEEQEVKITSEYICAIDADSESNSLVFLIARQPHHGKVLRHGAVIDRFVQGDVAAGSITYKHTGEEIGLSPLHDVITFVISDEESENPSSCCHQKTTRESARLRSNLPVYDLHITVFPVDNQTPLLSTGDIFKVNEGGTALITTSSLKAFDPDTELENLLISLISPPQFGFIENVLPTPGFEKSNSGKSISSFTYKDVMEGNINYVQSRHQRMEPTADQFMLCVSDGNHSSPHVPFYVFIIPTNDELPQFTIPNITVEEGQSIQLDASVLYAKDLDVPEDVLTFSVIQSPQHGSISTRGGPVRKRGDTSSSSDVIDFTMMDVGKGLSLMYTHDDSEMMKDGFTIQLTDGQHTLRRQVGITVQPVNDEPPRVIRNSGLQVNLGEARLISSLVLFAHDRDTPSSQLSYIFESLPTQGLLQLKERRGWVTVSAGRKCTQEAVDTNQLRYVHTHRQAELNKDFFVFHLQDGRNQSPSQYFHITLKDMKKGHIAIFVKSANISRGDRLVLCTDVLYAVDGADKPEELVYVITTPPSNGHLENLKHPGVVISTFSQKDVSSNLVSYVHDNRFNASTETLKFVVGNGKNSRHGSFEIKIETEDRVLPSLSSNKGLTVPRGSSAILGPDCLSLSDPDTPSSTLTFVLLKPPHYGTLSVAGTTMASGCEFTQKAIEDLEVIYKHDGGQSQIDRFSFTASDGTNQGFLLDGRLQTEPVFFTVQILHRDTWPPEVVKLLPLWEVEQFPDGRYGIFLSSREIKVQDAKSKDQELQFCIVRPPYFGYLENIRSGGFVTGCFSQRELTKKRIVYIIDVNRDSLSDSLLFTVSDPLGNTGNTQILDFQWSSVELSQSAWSTCEDQGTLSVEVLRKGNSANISFVTIEVTEGTATSGTDFHINAAFLIQFDPGLKKRKWTIEILHDDFEETSETFEVHLVSPEGTVIGRINKAIISIEDTGRGRCKRTPPQDKEASVLIGKVIWNDKFPQHGSIQLEKLPIGTGSIVITPRSRATETGLRRKKLRVLSNQRSVSPSTVFHNGTDTIYTYHGIMQLKVQDDTSSPRQGRKANIQQVNRGDLQQAPQYGSQDEDRPHQVGLNPHHGTVSGILYRPCVPELMGLVHLNRATQELLHCNGVEWTPWKTLEPFTAPMCPDGWTFHGDHCYMLRPEEKLSWSSATTACRERYKGTLASVLSKADMDWLWNFSGRKPFWIGLHDREGQGRWEWSDGQQVTFTNWSNSSPRRNLETRRFCVLVFKKAKWQIRDCKKGRGHGFVCSLKL